MEEVVDDLYLRKFADRPTRSTSPATQAVEIAGSVLDHPDARSSRRWSDGDDLPSIRRRFAERGRARRWTVGSGR